MSPLASALYQICLEEGNTSSIEAIRNLALQKIQAGEVKTIVSSSINGKSVNFNVSQPADKLFAEASIAIRLFNNGRVTVTQVDFTRV
jgi:hypothetical protein